MHSVSRVQHCLHSASITSTASKWRPLSFIFNRENRQKYGGWGTTVMLFLVTNSPVKEEVGENDKVRVEVFAFLTQSP
jgi:hypothetical protein